MTHSDADSTRQRSTPSAFEQSRRSSWPTFRIDVIIAIFVGGCKRSDDAFDKKEAYHFNVAGYLLKPVKFTDFVDLMAALNKYWTLVEF